MSTEHRIELDEVPDGPDIAFKAFCDCGWSARQWSHADEMPAWDPTDPVADSEAVNQAETAAAEFGAKHLANPNNRP